MPDSTPPQPPLFARRATDRVVVRQRPAWSYPLPWIVLVLGLAASAIAADTLRQRIRAVTSERFSALISVQEQQLQARFNAYIEILRGAKGLWASGGEVTREQWRRYVDTLEVDRSFPGIQAVAFAPVIRPGDVDRFERGVRAEAAAQPAALQPLLTGFAVHPAGARETYTPVLYAAPLQGRNLRAFGFDMWSDPVRRAAMERARDTGQPALSGSVRLITEGTGDVQQGFLVYLPIYRGEPTSLQERRDAIEGFVCSPFRAGDFMRNALPNRGLYVQYAIYDGEAVGDDTLMFKSERPTPLPPGQPSIVSRVPIAGHVWTVVSEPGPLLNTGADRTVALLVGGAGALIASLLAALMLAIARTRDSAQQLALRMTADLRSRESELHKLSTRLAQSNEDLQQFVYAASHDLKEPLRTIASSLGLVTQRYAAPLEEGGREFLGYATEAAQRLSSLIDTLLDYSRVQTQTAPHEPIALDPVLDHALQDLAATLADSGATVDRAPLPTVLANPDQVMRVFENLIGNAVKYARPATPPAIRIDARRDAARWVISVRDNGIGIAPEYHQRIFEMFKRLHTRSEYEGSGVGLALCKRIVQRHGGDIWVESQPGAGATFHFSLPSAPAVSEPGSMPAEASAAAPRNRRR